MKNLPAAFGECILTPSTNSSIEDGCLSAVFRIGSKFLIRIFFRTDFKNDFQNWFQILDQIFYQIGFQRFSQKWIQKWFL